MMAPTQLNHQTRLSRSPARHPKQSRPDCRASLSVDAWSRRASLAKGSWRTAPISHDDVKQHLRLCPARHPFTLSAPLSVACQATSGHSPARRHAFHCTATFSSCEAHSFAGLQTSPRLPRRIPPRRGGERPAKAPQRMIRMTARHHCPA
jgi:hypothetical protein